MQTSSSGHTAMTDIVDMIDLRNLDECNLCSASNLFELKKECINSTSKLTWIWSCVLNKWDNNIN